jgi:hypothetical protein
VAVGFLEEGLGQVGMILKVKLSLVTVEAFLRNNKADHFDA